MRCVLLIWEFMVRALCDVQVKSEKCVVDMGVHGESIV